MFGDRLKEARQSAGFSQLSLANYLSVSQQTVASWEVNRTSPAPEVIAQIANILAVTTDYLLGSDPVGAKKEPSIEISDGSIIKVSDLQFALHGEVHELCDEEIQELLKHAKLMRESKLLKKLQQEQGNKE